MYIPKSGDLTKNEDLLVIAERLRLCEQYESEVSGENKILLDKLKDRDSRSLKEKISDIYGYWVRITGFENGEIKYRLVPCSLDEVRSTVKASYDIETIRSEILKHLEGKGSGLKLEDIKYDFKATPGKPIVIVEALLEEALRSLYAQDKIVIEYKGKRSRTPDPLPSFKDDAKVILSKYVPSPEEIIKEEKVKEKKPKEITVRTFKPPESFAETEVELVEKEEERKVLLPIETSEHSSPYSLSVDVERKVPDGVRVKGVELEFSGGSFKDFKSFETFVKSLNIRKPTISEVKLKLVVEGPMSKGEIIELIDKLPPSLGGGKVKAIIEAEKIA